MGAGAILAVFRARTTTPELRAKVERPSRARQLDSFKTPIEAQAWVDWRRHGRYLPIATAIMLAVLSVPLFFQKDLMQWSADGTVFVNPYQVSFAWCLVWVPFLVAGVTGVGALRSYIRGSNGVYDLFFATRPLSNDQMLAAKYRSATKAVLVTSLVGLGFALLWSLVPGERRSLSDYQVVEVRPFLSFLLSDGPVLLWLEMTGLFLLSMIWSWRNLVVGFAADLTPVPSARGLYATVAVASAAGLFVAAETSRVFVYADRTELIAGLAALLILKLYFAARLSIRLNSHRHGMGIALLIHVGAWLTLAGIATVIAFPLFLYAGFGASLGLSTLALATAMSALLLVPLARPIGARVALDLGRSRP
jgi:hypothetical protein